jgi:hypothetical protein
VGLALVVSSSAMAYEVVMATYNGSAYLNDQLNSIATQTRPPLRVLVADDGSIDGTIELLHQWQLRDVLPIQLLSAAGHLGSCRSFERALGASRAPYLMPADQDDLWDVDKAERLLDAMAEQERLHGKEVPLLVHTDLRLINARGELLASSFHRYVGLRPQQHDWRSLAIQNVVTGCSLVVNRACLQAALPFPAEAVLHDWWLALVAARLGSITYLGEPGLSYRQHGSNAVGARGRRQQFGRVSLALARGRQGATALVRPGLAQLQACGERFSAHFSPVERLCLHRLGSQSAWQRLWAALVLRLHKQGLVRTLGFYCCLVLSRGER